MPTTILDDSGAPVEIAPGRGDLNKSSVYWGPEGLVFPTTLQLVGNKTVSYAKLFQTQPWVAAAVMRMLTWSVRVPLKVYKRTGEDSRERLWPGDHPLADSLRLPWERGYLAALVQAFLGPLLVHGNSMVEVEEGARGRLLFTPHDWRFLEPIWVGRDNIGGWKVNIDLASERREVSGDNVVHTAWWSPTGQIGTSPLQQLGTTIAIEDAAQRWQKAMFVNGGRPASAVMASEAFLGIDATERREIMANLRTDLNYIYGQPENAGKPALLPPGLDWKGIGHNSQEAELIETRKVARDEVIAVYQIPPPMMGILDKATLSNIEVQREMIYTDCMGPPLVLVEQTINSHLVWGLLREDDLYVEFDFAAVLRGDRLKEIEALREAIATAVMTPNEGRTKINLPRSDDPAMDQFYLPRNNLWPIGTEQSAITSTTGGSGSE